MKAFVAPPPAAAALDALDGARMRASHVWRVHTHSTSPIQKFHNKMMWLHTLCFKPLQTAGQAAKRDAQVLHCGAECVSEVPRDAMCDCHVSAT